MATQHRWTSSKKLRALAFLAGAFASAMVAAPAVADMAYKVTSIISLPGGQQITSVDIGFTDPVLSQYAVTDRKNKSVDVIDTKTNTLLFQAVGFCGLAGHHLYDWHLRQRSRPQRRDLRRSQGSLGSRRRQHDQSGGPGHPPITHTISLGLTKRADELCHDPVDNLVLIASDKDAAIQFIDTKSYTNVTNTASKKIVLDGTNTYPKATNGIEQCQYNPRNGMFYLAVPEVNGAGDDQTPGAVLVISPQTQRVVATMPLPLSSCAGPQGLTIGPAPQILLGCSNNGPATAIIDERDGHVLATFQGLNGNDEVYFNSVDNHYFLAESNAPNPAARNHRCHHAHGRPEHSDWRKRSLGCRRSLDRERLCPDRFGLLQHLLHLRRVRCQWVHRCHHKSGWASEDRCGHSAGFAYERSFRNAWYTHDCIRERYQRQHGDSNKMLHPVTRWRAGGLQVSDHRSGNQCADRYCQYAGRHPGRRDEDVLLRHYADGVL